jgi:hypothetical protein
MAPGLGLYDKYFQSSFSSGIQSSNFILILGASQISKLDFPHSFTMNLEEAYPGWGAEDFISYDTYKDDSKNIHSGFLYNDAVWTKT